MRGEVGDHKYEVGMRCMSLVLIFPHGFPGSSDTGRMALALRNSANVQQNNPAFRHRSSRAWCAVPPMLDPGDRSCNKCLFEYLRIRSPQMSMGPGISRRNKSDC